MITFTGIKDSAGNTVPDGTLVGITAANGATTDPLTGLANASVGGSILGGTSVTFTPFRVFSVINGSVSVMYQPPSTAGIARIQIAPARQSGGIIQSTSLIGAVWTIQVQ
jgi:hypothetical protein